MCFPLIKRSRKTANIGQEIGMSRGFLIVPSLRQKHTSLANAHTDYIMITPYIHSYTVEENREMPPVLSLF